MRKSIFFNNQISDIKRLNGIVEEIGNELNMNAGEVFNSNLILEEVLSNIIFYGYEKGVEDQIEIIVKSENGTLTLEVLDGAKPFDLTIKSQDAHIGLSNETQVGGLGILLIKKLSKSIEYKRENGKNHLIIKL